MLWTKKKPPNYRGFICGRYWDRTSDLFRVREARYRCANRPFPEMFFQEWRWVRDSNPCIRLCRPLPRLSANPPLWFHTKRTGCSADSIRADDEIRTRDPHLGKVMRYHCATSARVGVSADLKDSSRFWPGSPHPHRRFPVENPWKAHFSAHFCSGSPASHLSPHSGIGGSHGSGSGPTDTSSLLAGAVPRTDPVEQLPGRIAELGTVRWFRPVT